MKRESLVFLLALALAACASNPVPEGFAEPSMVFAQTGGPDVQVLGRTSDAPFQVRYTVQIRNEDELPMTVERIEMQSIGQGPFRIPGVSRAFGETIEGGAVKRFEVWATAIPGLGAITGPVTIRTTALCTAEGATFRKVVTQSLRMAE